MSNWEIALFVLLAASLLPMALAWALIPLTLVAHILSWVGKLCEKYLAWLGKKDANGNDKTYIVLSLMKWSIIILLVGGAVLLVVYFVCRLFS